uniref:(California timema) hypothetical protein n=1 Tax=Timema californicum TaxID=61474 RepID=A0A7R9PBP6_TIMCA|nr:unnamed protein product [Timema californicum]
MKHGHSVPRSTAERCRSVLCPRARGNSSSLEVRVKPTSACCSINILETLDSVKAENLANNHNNGGRDALFGGRASPGSRNGPSLTLCTVSVCLAQEDVGRSQQDVRVAGRRTMILERTIHPTEIRISISPSSAVELNTTSALANHATEAGTISRRRSSLLKDPSFVSSARS